MSLQIRNINGTTRDATKSARARNGFRTVPNKALRRVGRVVGAIGAIAGAAGTYVAYESAYETCRTASAELGKVTPRAQHVGWFFCVGANTFVAIAGAAGCFFGRGALCGPTKKQIANRMQDELLLQVMLYTPAPVQVGVTPRGERVMRLQTPAPSGLTHLNHLNRAFSRRGKKTQKMEPPTSWTHGNSSGGVGNEWQASRETRLGNACKVREVIEVIEVSTREGFTNHQTSKPVPGMPRRAATTTAFLIWNADRELLRAGFQKKQHQLITRQLAKGAGKRGRRVSGKQPLGLALCLPRCWYPRAQETAAAQAAAYLLTQTRRATTTTNTSRTVPSATRFRCA